MNLTDYGFVPTMMPEGFLDDKDSYLRQKQQWGKDIAKWSKQIKKNGKIW